MCCRSYGPLTLSPLINQREIENNSEWQDEYNNIVFVDEHTPQIETGMIFLNSAELKASLFTSGLSKVQMNHDLWAIWLPEH